MRPKRLRPAAPGGAHRAVNSKELGSAFHPEINCAMPIAQARIVVGCRASFLYIGCCPLCRIEHTHGLFVHGQGTDPLHAFKWHGGHHASHCFCQGPGRHVRFVRGRWRTFVVRPPEWCEPHGDDYRLVLSEPACFTARGIRSGAARHAMMALARRGVQTSLMIWTPRRSCFRGLGDR